MAFATGSGGLGCGEVIPPLFLYMFRAAVVGQSRRQSTYVFFDAGQRRARALSLMEECDAREVAEGSVSSAVRSEGLLCPSRLGYVSRRSVIFCWILCSGPWSKRRGLFS